MVLMNWAKQTIANLIGGSTTLIPAYFMIGSGSGTVALTQTQLVHAADRQIFTTINNETAYKIKYTGDWNAIEMSGLGAPNAFPLREIGISISGAGITGSMWSNINFPAINFNGLNELRVEENWEIF
ncbi:hypothetical protein KKF61_07705 [Patescibacteria group bacterium]|nr:hypothetical protein [Patescibacteria group bacterium]